MKFNVYAHFFASQWLGGLCHSCSEINLEFDRLTTETEEE